MIARVAASLVALAVVACSDDSCPDPSSDRTCRVARIAGTVAEGQLGFRFGEPLDVDGDGRADIVAGARHAGPNGEAGVWSIDGTAPFAQWGGEHVDGLFGHVALAVPDLEGDGHADVVVSAPNAVLEGGPRGIVDAYSSTGARLWRAVGALYDGFGWHIERAGDHDGDGVEDLWIGAPSNPARASVYLIAGRDGHVLLEIPSSRATDQFGWYVAATGDLDGDGRGDVAIGAPVAVVAGVERGAVILASSATGETIRELTGDLPDHLFGQMIAALDDLDGDGVGELAIASPGGRVESAPGTSEVVIASAATGARLRLLPALEDGELYGRMLATVDDLDGDDVRDLAIGAPWHAERAGRVEVRSARTNAVLAEVTGEPGEWLGWHLARARGGFAVSRLRYDAGRGAVEVHELR